MTRVAGYKVSWGLFPRFGGFWDEWLRVLGFGLGPRCSLLSLLREICHRYKLLETIDRSRKLVMHWHDIELAIGVATELFNARNHDRGQCDMSQFGLWVL
jgi:hypothetical protein